MKRSRLRETLGILPEMTFMEQGATKQQIDAASRVTQILASYGATSPQDGLHAELARATAAFEESLLGFQVLTGAGYLGTVLGLARQTLDEPFEDDTLRGGAELRGLLAEVLRRPGEASLRRLRDACGSPTARDFAEPPRRARLREDWRSPIQRERLLDERIRELGRALAADFSSRPLTAPRATTLALLEVLQPLPDALVTAAAAAWSALVVDPRDDRASDVEAYLLGIAARLLCAVDRPPLPAWAGEATALVFEAPPTLAPGPRVLPGGTIAPAELASALRGPLEDVTPQGPAAIGADLATPGAEIRLRLQDDWGTRPMRAGNGDRLALAFVDGRLTGPAQVWARPIWLGQMLGVLFTPNRSTPSREPRSLTFWPADRFRVDLYSEAASLPVLVEAATLIDVARLEELAYVPPPPGLPR